MLRSRFATLRITNSHYTLRKMRQHVARFRGEACPLGLSPEIPLNMKIGPSRRDVLTLRAADGEARVLGERVLLLVARMDARERGKGHRELINLLPSLLGIWPDVQLVFPGPGEDRRNLKTLAARKGVASSVFLPGFVPGKTLIHLYRHCYAFVMPSRQEGFGLAYLEAMNFGKPCVGCFDQGAEDVIVHGETGLLVVDPSDTEDAREFGSKGFDRLHAHFTPARVQTCVKEKMAGIL
ncbi:MAG: glycosyltransferase family 4 protein [Gemmatimonadetes bacterium]|nr:glycosyltransferase family 4 protein [Gemmatimonadota bacterium]